MDKKALYLVQTDTTVGFLSQDRAKLARAKNRPKSKEFLSVYSDFKTFKKEKNRIPNIHKNFIRASKRTTVITKNRASRVVLDSQHHEFLVRFGYLYSTSANESGKKFNETFVRSAAEISVEDINGFRDDTPSKLLKLSPTRKVRLR
ncbi:MAG: Sua5 YciO YrdC YwlC family protein [Campylobacterota bacterium]|nr:Sua5 YciO YrdC YwlC family protein [Campylobacterota bacterium]